MFDKRNEIKRLEAACVLVMFGSLIAPTTDELVDELVKNGKFKFSPDPKTASKSDLHSAKELKRAIKTLKPLCKQDERPFLDSLIYTAKLDIGASEDFGKTLSLAEATVEAIEKEFPARFLKDALCLATWWVEQSKKQPEKSRPALKEWPEGIMPGLLDFRLGKLRARAELNPDVNVEELLNKSVIAAANKSWCEDHVKMIAENIQAYVEKQAQDEKKAA